MLGLVFILVLVIVFVMLRVMIKVLMLMISTSRATADVVICQYCKKTFRNKNSLGCHIWR